MSFLYLSKRPEDVARRAELQRQLRELLEAGEARLMRKLWMLPHGDPLRLRVEEEDLFVTLQTRLPHADTPLARKLTALADDAIKRFASRPGSAHACKSAYDAALKAKAPGGLDIPKLVEYESCYRIVYALKLAADILLQISAVLQSHQLQVKAFELLAQLEPNHPDLVFIDRFRSDLQRASPMSAAEQVAGCIAAGYQELPSDQEASVRFVANRSGALAAFWQTRDRMDIDLTSIVRSMDDLPDLKKPAVSMVGDVPSYPNFAYADCAGRGRELVYVPIRHRYDFA